MGVTKAQLEEQGIVVRQEYDGLAKHYSDVTALVCDPDAFYTAVQEDGTVVTSYPGKSLTRQSEADAADINKILERIGSQGIGPILNASEPRFLDISDVPDFQGAIHQVRDAKAYFDQLDAVDRRDRFNNDVGLFLDTVNDPVKLEALIAEGIVVDGSIVGGPPPVVPPVVP